MERFVQLWNSTIKQKRIPSATEKTSRGLEERGESKTAQAVQESTLTVFLWQDNRSVVVISTNLDPTTTTNVKRKMWDGTSTEQSCPNSVAEYNRFMGGVDGMTSIRTKCRKHYKYLFCFLFDLAITNAYILYKTRCKMTILGFRVTLAKELIGTYCSRKSSGLPSISSPSPIRFHDDHFPTKATHQRCHYHCHHNNERRTTTLYCCACQLYLCHTGKEESDCFWKQHH